MLSVTSDGDRAVVTLPGTLDNGVAAPLKEAFLEALAAGKPVLAVEAGAVERLSTACIQVLIAAGRAAAEAGREFVVMRPGEPLIAAFDDLGLFSVMMGWRIEA
ncbi:STAS domain-containing protein [Caenispirillum bisanense]|uniref:Anti-anti-sigma regulatory factor (Antagonist of anti-sigma factor) n=1 Tax=Caenispirillum bisanense TaxID=414052 RepID=A0A286G3T7_9PROT|nr:STAS domain-containing protein [Caenispirillum bisanense]SOD90210.1 Anti-anti-sigma regulatory factor (antagonist of anti-sigma factor) [Caenispirillum bisanense]